MELEKEIAWKITPDEKHRQMVEKVVSDLMKRIRTTITDYEIPLEPRLVGSVAKDTYLPYPDIDIFIMFPPFIERKDLEKIGLDIGKKVLNGEQRYAEHPYIHGQIGGFEVDLVPCYKVLDPCNIKSAVDRTPFHTEFIKKHLKEEQKVEVRLLKQFMKGIGVYGAEAKIQGFSGYLVELLILKYSTFISTIHAASSWKFGETLWLENRSESQFKDPLIFYDPVDPFRNVASPVSVDSFARFIYASREYIARKSERFFFPRKRKQWKIKEIRKCIEKRGTSILVVAFNRPEIVDDDLYPQIRKTEEGIANLLREHDFVIIDKNSCANKRILIAFELESINLPFAKRHSGPPMWIDHSKRFLERWRGGRGFSEPFIDGGRLVVIAKREYCHALSLIEEKIKCTSLGKDFRELPFRTYSGKMVFRREFKGILTMLLDKRMPWEI
ncbi:MAG: CCA tRNA nucleotidyltransferase [Methanomassiliicoccales archaeon]